MKVRLMFPALLLLVVAPVAGVPMLEAQSGPALGFSPQVFVVRSDGSGLRQLTSAPGSKWRPTWSRDGRRLAYAHGGIHVFTLATGTDRELRRTRRSGGPSAPAWSPRRDELLYTFGSGTEDRPRANLATLREDGSRFRLLASWQEHRHPLGDPVWSPDGERIAYLRERKRRGPPPAGPVIALGGPLNVAVVSRLGRARRAIEVRGDEFEPQWAPDGRSILFGRNVKPAQLGLWRMSPRGRALRRIGPKLVNARTPSWSHDGTRVAFSGHTDTGARQQALYVLPAVPRAVPRMAADEVAESIWSPAEDLIAFADFQGNLRVTAPDGSGSRALATFAPDTEFHYLAWSRDGRWLAFTAQKQRPGD